MTDIDRSNWILLLEAHYGRIMALNVKQTAEELQKAADRVADRTHPFLRENHLCAHDWSLPHPVAGSGTDCPGGMAAGRHPEELLQHCVRVSVREILKDVTEARQALMTARQVRDEDLPNFVRWRTLPNWRATMEGLGYRWDDETLRWLVPGVDVSELPEDQP